MYCEEEKPKCTSETDCKNLKNECQCYCSFKCGFRDKIVEDDPITGVKKDEPIYIPDDPNGKFCYCKQRDVDFYNKNHCPQIEKIKEERQKQKTAAQDAITQK